MKCPVWSYITEHKYTSFLSKQVTMWMGSDNPLSTKYDMVLNSELLFFFMNTSILVIYVPFNKLICSTAEKVLS
jgi:hypothetical protein